MEILCKQLELKGNEQTVECALHQGLLFVLVKDKQTINKEGIE
jgi:hypothetical protein